MSTTYDDVLTKDDLENLDSFLKAWEKITTVLSVIPGAFAETPQSEVEQRQKECADLRRKLAVAIHLGGV